MNSTGSELLQWQTPIDLRGITGAVTLSFQSWYFGDGFASVLLSTDGLNWQQLSAVPESDNWTSINVDLSDYVGGIILIAFVWQDTNVQTLDHWTVDDISVTESILPVTAPELPILPGATAPGSTPVETAAPELSPMPSDTPTIILSLTGSATSGFDPSPQATEDRTNSTDGTPSLEPEPTASVACDIDVNGDGTITESDLAAIAEALLGSDVSDSTSRYDRNGNRLIDIGDIQMLTSYLYTTCPQ